MEFGVWLGLGVRQGPTFKINSCAVGIRMSCGIGLCGGRASTGHAAPAKVRQPIEAVWPAPVRFSEDGAARGRVWCVMERGACPDLFPREARRVRDISHTHALGAHQAGISGGRAGCVGHRLWGEE